MEVNPYESPIIVDTGLPGIDSAPESLRRKYLRHETSIRLIGLLYLMAGVAFACIVIVMLGEAVLVGRAKVLGIVALLACVPFLQISMGLGLRRLKPWTRVPVTIFSLLGLFAFPLGTLINGYILWLMNSDAGKTVFSPEYQAIIPVTSHIQNKTSFAAKLVLGLVVALVLIVIGIVATLP